MNIARKGKTAALAGALLVLALAAGWYVSRPAPPAAAGPGAAVPAPAAGAASLAGPEAPCHQVLRCAAEQALQEASSLCRAPIQEFAVFAPRWKQAIGEPIFTEYAWLDAKRGTLTFRGNRLEFQDGSGTFAPVAYECDFDPTTRAVIDARVRGAGRP